MHCVNCSWFAGLERRMQQAILYWQLWRKATLKNSTSFIIFLICVLMLRCQEFALGQSDVIVFECALDFVQALRGYDQGLEKMLCR